jgi:hypothetical protein
MGGFPEFEFFLGHFFVELYSQSRALGDGEAGAFGFEL